MHRSDQFPRFYITVLKTVSIRVFKILQQLLGCRINKIWRHGSVVSVYFIVSACFSPNCVDFFYVGDFQENWIKGKWTLRPHPSSYSETFWTLRPEIRSGNHDNLVPLSLFFFLFSWKETCTPVETTLRSLYLERERKESNVRRDFAGSSVLRVRNRFDRSNLSFW